MNQIVRSVALTLLTYLACLTIGAAIAGVILRLIASNIFFVSMAGYAILLLVVVILTTIVYAEKVTAFKANMS